MSTKNLDPDTPKLNTDSFWSTTVQTLNESKTSFVIGTLPFLRVDEDESLPQYPVDNAPFPESKTSFIGEESFLGRVHEVVPSREVSFVMENTVNEEHIGIVEPHHHDGKLFSYSSTFLSPLCVFFLFR